MQKTTRRGPRKHKGRRGRHRTFSGCTTCRSRHVKCDEARPACQRCLISGFDCLGYPGYRSSLEWRSLTLADFGDVSLPNHVQRPSVEAESDYERTASSCSTLPSTPHRSRLPNPTAAGDGSHRLCVADQQANISVLPSDHEENSPSNNRSRELWASSSLHSPASGQITSARDDICGPSSSPQNSLNHLIECLDAQPSSVNIECEGGTIVTTKCHLDLLDNLHYQRRLIEHWVEHLSDALMPIPGPSNPLKSIFVPIANAGALSAATESSGSVALFYLVSSSAAFHLSANADDGAERSEFMTLALSHHSRGIRHLHDSLSRDDPFQAESILASLLLCLSYEPATVDTSFWITHLNGAARWLQRHSIKELTETETTAILFQTLVGSATLLRSQPLPTDLSENDALRLDSSAIEGTYYLDRIFGLGKEAWKAVSQVIELAVCLRNTTEDDAHRWLGESQTRLDRMEIELYLAMPTGLVSPMTGNCQQHLAHHYSWLFYISTMVYFKRIVRNSTLDEVQPLVQQALDHIEALQYCTSRPFCPLMWPVAIVLFEIKDTATQMRATKWLDYIMDRSTISIWKRAKPIFLSFWAKREDAKPADLQWDTYLSDPSTPSIMLV